jgi:hypothetical protein
LTLIWQALSYATVAAHILHKIYQVPPPIVLCVVLSNGLSFVVQKVVFNNFDLTRPPHSVSKESRNLYLRTPQYNIYQPNTQHLDWDAVHLFKFLCDPVNAWVRYQQKYVNKNLGQVVVG